jgi:hypothetical protein
LSQGAVWFGLFVHPFSHMCKIGHITKLQKATNGWLSVRMEQLGSHWTDFHEI